MCQYDVDLSGLRIIGFKNREDGKKNAFSYYFAFFPTQELAGHIAEAFYDLPYFTVSKWQIDYLASDAEVVDVTLEMAKLIEPKSGTLEGIPELMKKEPLTEEEVERLEREHPH